MTAAVLLACLLAAPASFPVLPQGNVVRPFADGMVYEGNGNRNYGTSTDLRVRASPSASYRFFLGFDLTGVANIQEAKLRLRCTDDSPEGGALFVVDASGCTESNLTWNRQPVLVKELAVLGAVSSNSWVEVDVSDVVRGPGIYAFGLVGGNDNSAYYSSREGAYPPELEVVVDSYAPEGIWISAAEIESLRTSGAAWDELLKEANLPTGTPHVADQDDDTDVRVLAKALVYARTGNQSYRTEVIDACLSAIGTEVGGETLALGRNLVSYVLAADLVQLTPQADQPFRAWLLLCLSENLAGRTLRSTHEDRPNNWGTHAGASRVAVAAYLGDDAEIARCAQVFKGWLGDRSSYAGFDYGELYWQADASKPVGINPLGATRNGHSIDGVLPDDQRRAGGFTWPPPKENYVWEALQGALVQAVILDRKGYDTWNWEDRALLRAVRWLHDQCGYEAQGDDTWQPHLINFFCDTSFPAPIPSRTGKNMGFTDWTHPPN